MTPRRILIIDNFDSFTYNLFQYCAELSRKRPTVIRNNEKSLQQIKKGKYTHIILSPGPGSPHILDDFGICMSVIRELFETPILGVCLGHQGIAVAFGGEVVRAPKPMHGKSSTILLDTSSALFSGLPRGITAMRYHSLVIKETSLSKDFRITAREPKTKLIMGIEHMSRPLFGIQFHPESIGTPQGKNILENFLSVISRYDPGIQ